MNAILPLFVRWDVNPTMISIGSFEIRYYGLMWALALGISAYIFSHIIKREGKTALMVTHDISEAICVSDRIAVLTRRPATLRAMHCIRFDLPENSPMARREAPEFRTYFNQIWKELDRNDG